MVAPGHAPVSQEVRSTGTAVLEVTVQLSAAQFAEQVTVEASERLEETATRLPATLHETPRSVSVIDSARIRDQNFRGVNDALAYVPGMTVNSYRREGYHFYSRGYRMLPDDTRVDGFAGVNAGGGFGATLFGVEQAVMLRGPAGLLYGSSASPGGLINLVTKKPLDMPQTTVDVRVGGYAGDGVGFAERGTMASRSTPPGRWPAMAACSTAPWRRRERELLHRRCRRHPARYLNGSLTFRSGPRRPLARSPPLLQ